MAQRTVGLFNCQLRLGGNLNHSVPILAATDRELLLLKRMHGDDAVVDVKEAGKTEMDERVEMFQLARKYANTAHPMSGRDLVQRHFQTALVGYEQWLEQTQQDEEMIREIRREEDAKDIANFTAKQLRDRAAMATAVAERASAAA